MLKRVKSARLRTAGGSFAIVASKYNAHYVNAMVRAAQAVDSGAGEQVLARWVELSTRLRGSPGS